MRNVELKARLESLEQARRIARRVATDELPDQHQVDTYFVCQRGRLKLREINNATAELIWYLRDDVPGAKTSRYEVLPVDQPAQQKDMLAAALGLLTVVEKHRQIVLHGSVRIHLDSVSGLGEFLEFEATLAADEAVDDGHRLVEQLRQTFAIQPSQLVTGSYSDLLLARLPQLRVGSTGRRWQEDC